jgi:alpha-glucosidase
MWQEKFVSEVRRMSFPEELSLRRVLGSSFLVLLLVSSGLIARDSRSPSSSEVPGVVAFIDSPTVGTALPSGIEVRSGKSLLRVEALRDDVLRVRIAEDGALAEDASWAVLPVARTHRVNVTPQDDEAGVGFRTSALLVKIDRNFLRLVVSDLQGHILQNDAAGWPLDFHGSSYRIYKRMPETEHYFGLGDKVGSLDRRNQSFSLWNTDYFGFQESGDPIYKSIPFFLAFNEGRSIGVLLDSTWRTNFDFGQSVRDVYSFGAEGGSPDYYLIYGPEPKKVVETYAWMTGTPPLPPLWAFGYQQARFSYESEARVREIANHLRADKIPSDVIYLDIDFQQNHRPFTVDTQAFPHFPQMIADLRQQQFHVVAITDLHIADLPSAGYLPYDSGISGNHFVKNADGSVYVGDVWPGPSVFPDFTDKGSRDWWGTLYKQFIADGVSGFWNDMNEPSVFKVSSKTMPLTVQHRIDEPGLQSRLAAHSEIHNVYGMENSRATYDGLLKLDPVHRPFVLTRATYAGGQRYAATWTGDNTSSWNHLRLTTPMILNLGLSGFGMTGADVGGFIGTPKPELLTKWVELAAFQPIDRNHTNKGSGNKEPWVYGPEQEAIQRRYIEERYRLLPYLYTTAEEMTRTGVPILRPLFLEFPNATLDGSPLDVAAGNQFLLGSALLVAPPPFPEQSDDYVATLPGRRWFDYWKGDLISEKLFEPTTSALRVPIHPELETLPVFVRSGSILPLQPLVQSTSERPDGPLTLRVYPGDDCGGTLYLDDGSTFEYRDGAFLRLHFSCEKTASGWKVSIGPHQGRYKPWWSAIQITLFGWDAPRGLVSVQGKALSASPHVDSEHHSITVEVPDSESGETIEFDTNTNSRASLN